MAEGETPQVAAQEGPGTVASETQPPEWQQTFKTPEDIWNGYKNLKSQYDKTVAEAKKTQTAPQQQPKAEQQGASPWDFSGLTEGYESLAHRIDIEAAKGEFSPEVASFIEAIGSDPEFYKEAVQIRQAKRLEPLKQYIEGDHQEIMGVVAANIDPQKLAAFRSNIDAGEYEAAAAIVKSVLAKVNAEGSAPKVGQVSNSPGGGYKDFGEVLADRKAPEYMYDKEWQAKVARKWEATDPALREKWHREYTSGINR